MKFTRRELLTGLMLAGGYCLLPFGSRGWALAAPDVAQRRMLFIFMRGAVDGLSIVTPYSERNYYNARPNIAIAAPGETGGLLYLDGNFGLNPALSPLMPLWQDRTLAFIHASGSPSETRSHFEAQDIMEAALLNSAMATQGWMNGMAQALPDNRSPTRALSFGNTMPKIFEGRASVSTVPNGIKGNGGKTVENPHVEAEFNQLYSNNAQLGGLYHDAVSARASMMQDLSNEMVASAKGAPGADAFVTQCGKAAEMIQRDPTIQLVFMDVGGWDTHVSQGNAKGQLANRLGKLGDGLAALTGGLGAQYDNTAILIMSEFGRTVAENGNHGTDHGHGNVAWLMGGGVRGGKIYGRWPGLETAQLYEGRDLAVTTDFRSVIGTVANRHFGLDDASIRRFINGYQPDAGLSGIMV
jgi:uncharacterized protein (DUF1501 family)